ncbi:MAG: hypothetical protein P8163_09355, partial [Candidatus Thiodiazotropha sp.]
VDSLVDEGHSEEAGEPERPHYTDFNMNAGLTFEGKRDGTTIRSDVNLVGSSVREQALRYSERGADAPKLDLSDYLVEIEEGNTSFSMGHSSFGQNPLLISSISNRGATFRHQLSDSFDFAIASQNGTDIVGYNNLFGLRSLDHNITGGTLGYELFSSRPGALRMEISYVTAEIQSDSNFDVGEVVEAEQSDGYGVRLLGSTESGRLRGELNYARSSYTNPQDDALNEGIDGLVEVDESTNSAYRINLSYDLLSSTLEDETTPLSLTVSLLHERVDPLYKTLAAFPNADVLLNQVEIVSIFGSLALQLQHSWMEDNLDDIASILKTKTESTVLSATYDLSLIVDEEATAWYLPEASLALNRVYQYAANNPDEDESGFNGGSHLPNQNNLSGDLGLSWRLDNWGLSYTYSYSDQDNRQTGRENDDFKTDGHSLEADIQLTDNFQFGLSVGRVRNENVAELLNNYTESAGLNFNWNIQGKWGLSGSVEKTLEDDSKDLVENDSISADLHAVRHISLPFPDGKKRHGQLYMRYNLSDNESIDNEFEFESLVKSWTVTAGLSFSFF